MMTDNPLALKFSVLAPALELPPLTVIGVVAEGVILKISFPVACEPTPIVTEGATSVPATVTVAPRESPLVFAVIVIGLLLD